MPRRRAVLLLLLFLVRPAAGAVTPAVVCEVVKLEAASRRARGLLTCHASALQRGTTLDPTCAARSEEVFRRLLVRAEARGGCGTLADGPPIVAMVDAFVDRVLGDTGGGDPACAPGLLQAEGRYASRLIGTYEVYKRSGGNAARLTVGQTRSALALVKELVSNPCASSVRDTLALAAEQLVDDLVGPLTCGDGVRDPAEVCDGADDRACPGRCQTDCRCAASSPFACLAGSGPLITLAGVRAGEYQERALPVGTRIDGRSGVFLASPTNLYPLNLAGGDGVCLGGGVVAGQYDRGLDWQAMHDLNNAGLRFESNALTVDGLRIDDVEDGIRPVGGQFTVRGAWLSYVRDDCIENDHLHGGLVEDSLFDGCYVAVSERPSPAILAGRVDGRRDLLTIHGSLLRLQAMPGPAGSRAPALGHGQFFKWHELATALALHDNVFLAERVGEGGPASMGMPPGLVSCSNNVMVWLGSGDYPAPLPPCFTVTGDRGVWDAAVAAWHVRHPEVTGP
jgi:hypothetical protein